MTEEINNNNTKRRRKKKPAAAIAYIDTEFNAFDYYGQNGGNQEIVQIGVVITKGGKVLDGFQTFCSLKHGHVLSKRIVKLTGIRPEAVKSAPSFPEALEQMNAFLDMYKPAFIYAYGSEDKLQMSNTAKLYRLEKEALRYVDRIEDNMKKISSMLGTRRKSNLSLSVKDLCTICELNADRPHDAYNDALYLAECSEIIKRGSFDPEQVQKVLDQKLWMSNYRMARRIKDRRESVIMEDEDFAAIRAMIATLQEEGQYPDYQLQAILDDLLAISGRKPGIENKV